jgi:hypothetical protein
LARLLSGHAGDPSVPATEDITAEGQPVVGDRSAMGHSAVGTEATRPGSGIPRGQSDTKEALVRRIAAKGDNQARHSVVTIVERKTGYLTMGKLARHCAADTTARSIELIERHRGRFATITSDNGSEFHGYQDIEAATGTTFYFATPHHSWERGTNENTNGLIRQYLPKRTSMAKVTQTDCDAIAYKLNSRPRKRLGYKTPEECYDEAR